jgi:hypothetical protein
LWQRLASDFLSNYIFLAVGRVGFSTDLIVQRVEYVQDADKRSMLVDLIHAQCLVEFVFFFSEQIAGKKLKGRLKAQSDAALPAKNDEIGKDGALAPLLRVARGPVLSRVAYSRAVEAVVTAAKRGVGREHGSEWRDATVRLLQSRSNSPLALLWAFLAFHEANLVREEDSAAGELGSVGSLVSVAQSLLHSLKLVTAGFCSGPTAIAAAAPIVQVIVHALAAYARSEKDAGVGQKRKEKTWKSLRKVMLELSGFISLCHHKDAPVVNGLFKAASVNIGLDIWLVESADFGSLFPFASQLKVDGFLNSIESVLYLGEVVETEAALLRLGVERVQGRSSASVSKKEELEKKLKHNVVLYTKFLGSSSIILDMLLDAPLRLGGVLADSEELILRDVLGEMAVVGVPNSGVFEEDIGALSAGDSAGKDSVAFLKRVMIARQLAGEFRSRREYLRASDLLAGLHRRGAPSELGEWLGERSALRVLIGTAVLQKQQDLVDWLLNESKADFNVVLDKAYIERLKTDGVEDVAAASVDLEEAEEGDEPLFFIDTSKSLVQKVDSMRTKNSLWRLGEYRLIRRTMCYLIDLSSWSGRGQGLQRSLKRGKQSKGRVLTALKLVRTHPILRTCLRMSQV